MRRYLATIKTKETNMADATKIYLVYNGKHGRHSVGLYPSWALTCKVVMGFPAVHDSVKKNEVAKAWRKISEVYPGITSQEHLNAWKQTIPQNETCHTNPYFRGTIQQSPNIPPFRLPNPITPKPIDTSHVLPPDRRNRTSPSTPKRSKQATEQPMITETYESDDDTNIDETNNRFSSLSHEDSESEDEYDDAKNTDTEEEEEVLGTNPTDNMQDENYLDDEPPQSAEAETVPNTKRPREDDTPAREPQTILVLRDLPENFSIDDVEHLLLGCNVETKDISHIALTHDGKAICTFATPSLAGTALFRCNGEIFNGYAVKGTLHSNTMTENEPTQPPQILNTAHAPGTTVDTAMTVNDTSDTEEAPFSQAFEQSLFFIRQVCPDSHSEMLESEINKNKDINELQALVLQWATNANKTLHRLP
jgi:hypothetical protein